MLNPDKVKLAIAPIGWTNDDMPDLGAENTFEQSLIFILLNSCFAAECKTITIWDYCLLSQRQEVT